MNKKLQNLSVHFIGVGGAGMSVLCKYLLSKNFLVSGSDKVESQTVRELISIGLTFYQGHNHNAVDNADVIIYTSAISEENPELVRARYLKKTILKRSELLNLILKTHKSSIGISGSHGKTTASFMLNEILLTAGVTNNSFIGGEYKVNDYDDSKVALAEVCEFDRNIDLISVDYPVCLNIDSDHLDTYGTLDNLDNAFKSFLNKGKISFINFDDNRLCLLKHKNAITFSINAESDYKAVEILEENGYYSFKVSESCVVSNRIYLGVLGYHNIYNALSAIAVARKVFNIEYGCIINALCSFTGAKRRFERVGNFKGKTIFCDYAHHPTEIKATLVASKKVFNNDYLVVFQPHTYSRTKNLFEEFKLALQGENLVIYKEYPSREIYDYLGSAKRLADGVNSPLVEDFDSLIEIIDNTKKKNILVLGAGDIYDLVIDAIKNG